MKKKGIVGVDEVGRGPLAGPVAVGVVYVPPLFDLKKIQGIKDSKQLSEKSREDVYTRIRAERNIRHAVVMISAATIDKYGIQHAIRAALRRALGKVVRDPREVDVLLDGGLRAPAEYKYQTTIIRGDATEAAIGAASIVAKVTRDRYMRRQHTIYPAYGFDRHKGYGTAEHRKAIRKYGFCPLHRRTFCSKIR